MRNQETVIEYRSLHEIDCKIVDQLLRAAPEFKVAHEEDHWTSLQLKDWIGNPSDCCYGAFINGGCIGFILTHYHKQGQKLSIENLYVSPEFRRLGIGSRLLRQVILFYKSQRSPIMRIVVLTQLRNQVAINFFQRCGFVRGEDLVWLQK